MRYYFIDYDMALDSSVDDKYNVYYGSEDTLLNSKLISVFSEEEYAKNYIDWMNDIAARYEAPPGELDDELSPSDMPFNDDDYELDKDFEENDYPNDLVEEFSKYR